MAWLGAILSVGSGRPLVRRITRSMSRSSTWLMVLAPAADRAPPTRVASTNPSPGQPSAATIIAGTVVTRSSSMMRGLVSST